MGILAGTRSGVVHVATGDVVAYAGQDVSALADGWVVLDGGLHATYARSVAIAGGTVLLAVSTGPGGGEAAVYRRPVQAPGRFERCRGLPADLGGNVDTGRLVGTASGTAALVRPAAMCSPRPTRERRGSRSAAGWRACGV